MTNEQTRAAANPKPGKRYRLHGFTFCVHRVTSRQVYYARWRMGRKWETLSFSRITRSRWRQDWEAAAVFKGDVK